MIGCHRKGSLRNECDFLKSMSAGADSEYTTSLRAQFADLLSVLVEQILIIPKHEISLDSQAGFIKMHIINTGNFEFVLS